MPVKTLAMNRLKGYKRNFYMDEHGAYRHEYVDFYPAKLVEEIITDLSNQVLEERKKWTSMFDSFRSKRGTLRKQRHGAVAEIGKSLGELIALTTVPWDKLTDNDVMLLEKDMERIIEEGIPNE